MMKKTWVAKKIEENTDLEEEKEEKRKTEENNSRKLTRKNLSPLDQLTKQNRKEKKS